MPVRRTHKKSRNGCAQCKQRRVKCDEIGPVCANCARRELPCSFLTDTDETTPSNGASESPAQLPLPPPPRPRSRPTSSTLRAQPSHLPTPPDLRPTATTPVPESSQTQARHMLELELMHHYSTSTYLSCVGLRESAQTIDAWQRFVPREALKYDYLLYGLLAFTALHIAKLTRPADDKSDDDTAMVMDGARETTTFSAPSSFYFQKALEYQDEAFQSFRSVLDHITHDNCNAAFAFSVLTTLLVIAVPGFEDGSEKDPTNKTMQAVFTMFEFIKGLGSLIAASEEWFYQGPWAHVLVHFHEFKDGEWKISNPDSLQVLRQLSSLNEELNDETDDSAENSKFKVNKRAIDNLELCFAKYDISGDSAGPGGAEGGAEGPPTGGNDAGDKGHILGWLAMAGADFVSLLHHGDSLALLIFLHWAVLLKNLESFWWSHNSAKALVAEVASMLHPRGSEWEHRTTWARKKVGLP